MVDDVSSITATPKLGIRVSDAVLSPVPPVEPSISLVRLDTGSLSVASKIGVEISKEVNQIMESNPEDCPGKILSLDQRVILMNAQLSFRDGKRLTQ